MRIRKARRGAGLADRIVQQLPALARYPGRLGDRAAEMVELAREILERRLQAPAQFTTAVGKEHVRDSRTDGRADTAHDAGLRFFRHTGLLFDKPNWISTSCVPAIRGADRRPTVQAG